MAFLEGQMHEAIVWTMLGIACIKVSEEWAAAGFEDSLACIVAGRVSISRLEQWQRVWAPLDSVYYRMAAAMRQAWDRVPCV